MKESPFGFRYTWKDMRPVRPLAGTMMLFQFLGAGIGYYFGSEPNWFDNVWLGGAAATFPGFLVGLVIQYRINAARITEHKVMVRRMGLVTLLLTLVALFVPTN